MGRGAPGLCAAADACSAAEASRSSTAGADPREGPAAEAAEAAGEQGRFWEMHDMLFENQEALEDEDLARYAANLELDATRLINEVLTGTYIARVREDFRSGARGGVNGTPTLFINGVRHEGTPDALLTALIERGL